MTVVAMKVVDMAQHPNADALRLYAVAAPTKEARTIIANLDHVYEIGDIVAIALPGSVLSDGTKIKPAKLRGIYSFSMALGRVKAEIGADLSSIYCQETVTSQTSTKLPC